MVATWLTCEPSPAKSTFAVLFVCTANECRSPIAEHLARALSSALGLNWRIASAGTQTVGGRPINPLAEKALAKHGLHPDPTWRSTRLTAALLAEADLVLTATARHRSRVVTTHPPTVDRTFQLLHFARLAAVAGADEPRLPASDPWNVLTVLQARRSAVQPVPNGADDIADPIGHRFRAFRSCAETTSRALNQMMASFSAG